MRCPKHRYPASPTTQYNAAHMQIAMSVTLLICFTSLRGIML